MSDYNMVKKEVNGVEYIFYNSYVKTKNGFAHVSELWIDGEKTAIERIGYLNRTWEKYNYQSVMQKCCRELLHSMYLDWKANWKKQNGIKRMTKEKACIMRKEFELHKPKSFVNLEGVLNTL